MFAGAPWCKNRSKTAFVRSLCLTKPNGYWSHAICLTVRIAPNNLIWWVLFYLIYAFLGFVLCSADSLTPITKQRLGSVDTGNRRTLHAQRRQPRPWMPATCKKILLMAWHAKHSTALLPPMATSRQPAALLPPIDGESFSLNSLEFDENKTEIWFDFGKHEAPKERWHDPLAWRFVNQLYK
jgi:hypothetical protein